MTYQFSIDLESEMAKITGRQHLNDVHYLVQIVRHALDHQPQGIHISLSAQRLELYQDGEPFNQDEFDLIAMLLSQRHRARLSAKDIQNRLGELEQNHGICFLSLFKNRAGFHLCWNGHSYSYDGSQFHRHEIAHEPGYRVVIEGLRPHATKELSELRFFCAGVACPIRVNGKAINKNLNLKHQVFLLSFENEFGKGVIGIPERGEACQIEFYKAGVRLGSKSFSSVQGKIFHAYWNQADTRFEASYDETVEKGDALIFKHLDILYQEIGQHFSEFSLSQKERLKQIALHLPFATFLNFFEHVPLWDSMAGRFRLTHAHLAQMQRALGSVLYTDRRAAEYPAYLPVLSAAERAFLSEGAVNCTSFDQGRRRNLWTRFKSLVRPRVVPPQEVDRSLLEDAHLEMLKAFNENQRWHRYYFTAGPSVMVDGEDCVCVYLDYKHPEIMREVKLWPDKRPAKNFNNLRLRLFAQARDLRKH